ncbi:FAD binding domain-containing protein [Saccharothrix algeriensis]|uniref:Carbon-monoxide dehydrogenase medium subunit n=1 Tax=Saccharothrix algeriensis TaxID=173560 RepID=A0A8T8I4D3_9PSEU|nr:xanthine dehydrogenase family protein subunit M [Saccharothrix algeriensis]MBM7811728.1 carbon-monoxide dehydrogenase medium subunit [Saccharothrix algeriensis]QTR05491.1 xanthine dehydrogenase family protein subunit M [Saccharothrix algeriensis]
MIPAAFDYLAPSTVDEAVRALAAGGEDAKVLAGGQSLLPVLRLRLAAPALVVDLTGLTELTGVHDEGDSLLIGAMTTHYEVQRDRLVREHAPLLRLAADTVADPQIRHRGTFGGALAHADPAGDLLAPALALDAVLVCRGPGGVREVPAADFFLGHFTTALAPDELLTHVRVPKLTGWGAHYEKFNRVAQSWSIVAVAVALEVSAGVVEGARVGLTNMGPTPVRARGVEQALVGRPATAGTFAAAAARAAEGTAPGEDAGADAEYRTHLARVLTERALTTAVSA